MRPVPPVTLALYMFGSDIERLFGSRFYLQYYFVCVITAAAAHFAHLGGMLGGWLMIQHRRGGFPFLPRRPE